MKFVFALLICVLVSFSASVSAQTGSVSDRLEKQSGLTLKQPTAPATFTLPPGIALGEGISARNAAAIALWNNRAFEADLTALDLSRADLVEAGVHRNFSLSSLLPVGAKPFEFLVAFPIEELWQRKRRIRFAEIDLERVTTGLVQNGLNLIRDVRLAHVNLWLAAARARFYQESFALRDRITTLTERRRVEGEATGLNVSIARADARLVEQQSERTRGEIEVMRARLRALMGMPGMPANSSAFTALLDEAGPASIPAIEPLIETALANRPDLRAAEIAIDAAAERAKWERSRVLAMMAPTLSIKEVGTSGLLAGPGLNLEVPVFNKNQGPISRADAEVVRAGRAYVALKNEVEHETREAHSRAVQAHAALARLRQETRPAIEQMIQRTEAARTAGETTLLEVLEATRLRFEVESREIDARADLERSLADLERAIGRTL